MKPQCRHVHIWTRAQAWAPCPATNTTSPPLIRLQWPLFIASGPWQHVGPLPMTGSSVPALVSQFWARVFFGLPGFLLSGGVHLQAPFVMRSCSILNTCPSHLRPLCVISLVMLRLPVFLYRSLLEILFGQKIWHIRLRHPLWNTFILLWQLRQLASSLNPTADQTIHCFWASLF